MVYNLMTMNYKIKGINPISKIFIKTEIIFLIIPVKIINFLVIILRFIIIKETPFLIAKIYWIFIYYHFNPAHRNEFQEEIKILDPPIFNINGRINDNNRRNLRSLTMRKRRASNSFDNRNENTKISVDRNINRQNSSGKDEIINNFMKKSKVN